MELYQEEKEMMRLLHGLARFVARNNLWSSRCPKYHIPKVEGKLNQAAESSTAANEHRRIRSNRLDQILAQSGRKLRSLTQ
jgi:hypothetical protein